MWKFFIITVVFLGVFPFAITQNTLYLKLPLDEAVFLNEVTSVEFTWNTIDEGEYTLEISSTNDFSTSETYNSLSNTITVNSTNLYSQTFWRVVSASQTSETRSLRLIDLYSVGNIGYHISADKNVSVTGNRVTEWLDQSNSIVAEQSNLDRAPELHPGIINNQPVIRFSRQNGAFATWLETDDLEFTNENYTFFGAYKETGHRFLSYLLARTAPNAGLWTSGSLSGGRGIGVVPGDGTGHFAQNLSSLTWNTNCFEFQKIHLNNIPETQITLIGSGSTGIRFNTIGVRTDDLNLNFYGDLGEIIIFSEQLNDSLRTLVHNYLSTKYTAYPDLGDNITTCAANALLSIPNDPSFSSILWSSGETNTTSITVEDNGWHWVEVEAFGRTIRDSIFVEGLVPIPQLNENSQTICLYDTLEVSFQSGIDPTLEVTWHDGSDEASVELFEAGEYYVTFENTLGCVQSSDTIEIVVNQFPSRKGLGEDRILCLNSSVFFNYGGLGQEPYDHLWGDGNTATSIEPVIPGEVEYTIEVTDAMGCVAQDTVNISLSAVEGPSVQIDFDTVCPFSENTFSDASIAAVGDGIAEQTWFFPTDTLTGETVNYIPPSPNEYIFELAIVTDQGCENSLRDTVRYHTTPEIAFTNNTVCLGNETNFSGQQLSPQNMVEWYWNFGDAETAAGGTVGHQYENDGTFQVELIGEDLNGCKDTTVQEVIVRPVPQVDFEFEEVCAGDIVEFTNLSTINDPGIIIAYNWTFGDGTFAGQTDPGKTYFNVGDYEVSLSASANNGCSNSISQPLKIHAYPTPNHSVGTTCAGIETTLTDASIVQNGSVAEVLWSFPQGVQDGFTTTYTFESEGNILVEQTVRSAFGCETSEIITVEVNDYLEVGFTFAPFVESQDVVIAEYPTSFTSTSIGASGFDWSLDTLHQANTSNTSYTVPETLIGEIIPVRLEIVNEFGCTAVEEREFSVLERKTDLAIGNLFVTEINGFYAIGVTLRNEGTTPINTVDLFLRSPNVGNIKETWTGNLDFGAEIIHVFEVGISTSTPPDFITQEYICVRGELLSEFGFTDSDLSNNETCKNVALTDAEAVLIPPYPNPSNSIIHLDVVLPSSDEVTIIVFDAMGRPVYEVINNQTLPAGLNPFQFDVSKLSSGRYTIQMMDSKGMYSYGVVVGG